MKVKFLISLVIGLIIFTSCSEHQSNGKTFILKGRVDGPNTEYLVLYYNDSSNVRRSDTIPIIDNVFFKEGHLNNIQKVAIVSNLSPGYIDANGLVFFLEPNKIDLTLKEGEFDKAKINGSKTQIENENLNKKLKPFDEEIELILSKRQKLIDKNKETSNENLETELKSLTAEEQKVADEIQNIKLQYAVNNPRSYISASIIDRNKKTLSNDSLAMFYDILDPIIKTSSYGLKIKEQIELHIVDTGDLAPSFSRKDIDGNILSLSQFKGKTVLLDFGAAWCKPCVRNHPEVKRIYDEYHPKGLEIITISFDKDKTIWKENTKNEKLNWYHIYEGFQKDGEEGSISKAYYVVPIPAYILIDKEGIIIDRYSGADKDNKDLNDLEEKINALLTSS